MRILLTGPNSFSGKFVLDLLTKAGHSVTVITRSAALLNVDNIHGDLTEIDNLSSDIDAVVHIAATSPNVDVTCKDLIYDNVLATENLIMLSKAANVKKFIFFSTLSVYGEVLDPVLTEDTIINNPCTYGSSKLMCESMLRSQSSFNTIAIRLPAVIGAGASRHWLANTVKKLQADQDVTIYNPNALFNNAVHVKNLAQLVNSLLQMPLNDHFDYINIASNGGLTIGEIVTQVKEILGSRSEIIVGNTIKKPFTISNEYAVKKYNFEPLEFSTALTNYLNESISNTVLA